MNIQKVKEWYARRERWISSLALVSGFLFDIFTLKRVDLLLENLWVIIHLCVAGIGIILINLFEAKKPRLHFWTLLLVQFTFGGLLSTYLVFYFRSASLSESWPFMLILVIAFIGNELFKKHYSRLVFQVTIFFLSIFSFAIYFVPVIVHQISDLIFVLSGMISLIVLIGFVYILKFFTREKFKDSRWLLVWSVGGLFALINILYFTNLIPPIPLSLKDADIYHSILHGNDGNYTVTYEPESWWTTAVDFVRTYSIFHTMPGKSLYVFTAVFSPTKFNTDIIHEWQYYDSEQKKWVTTQTITLPIVGGREGGYRTYSLLNNPMPGLWRVNVETTNGLGIGRVKFMVETATSGQDTPLETAIQ